MSYRLHKLPSPSNLLIFTAIVVCHGYPYKKSVEGVDKFDWWARVSFKQRYGSDGKPVSSRVSGI